MTASYALFQTANNTGIMTGTARTSAASSPACSASSRNLGLITGASVMGTVFAFAAATTDHDRAPKPWPAGCGSRSASRRF